MQIGEKIRKIRELKGLKQENIATAVGMSVTAYGNLERGTTPLPYDKLEEIAKALEVTVADIVTMPEEFTIHHITNSHVAVAQLACNYGNINNPEVEGYKLAIEKLDAEVAYLKAQVDKLTDKLVGK
jgi:transcriptional regulator with XRE-family HTH domain